MVANPKMVRFINILLGYALVAFQVTAMQCACFDLGEGLGFAILASMDFTSDR
jgi:hypothetical protein